MSLYPRLKRPKVAIACDVCRRRKIKCDGLHPECGPCRTRNDPNLSCSWDYNRSRLDIGRLRQQMQDLHQNGLSPRNAVGDRTQRVNASSSRLTPPPPGERRPGEPSGPESPASAMVGPTELEPGAHGFFGGSSAGSFVASIRNAVIQRRTSTPIQSSFRQGGRCRMEWETLTLDECALPPRTRADGLMMVYWEAVHPLYPFVDRVAITRQYEQLFSVQASCQINSSLLCTLNIIFALSCQLDTTVDPERRHQSTLVFFERAQKLLDLWRLPSSLESVQVLLLLAQYLQSTNEPLQCWIFVGWAVRVAENLGLHLKESSDNASCPQDREMMRRVWHGCVMMDRVSAMAYGRPTMIHRAVASRAPLPVPVDEEVLDRSTSLDISQVAGSPSRLHFFIESLKLYDILDEILRMLYSNKDRERAVSQKDRGRLPLLQAGGASILDIDGRLMAWEANLPPQLRHDRVDPTQPQQQPLLLRQAIVLRQRFLHIRLLALRPVLYGLISSLGEGGHDTCASYLAPRLAHHCAIICVNVARESIELAHAHRDSTWATTGLLSAWWYNVLFVSSAAAVLLAARLLRSSVLLDVSYDSISLSWARAMDFLKGYRHYSESIPALIATLDMLFKEVSDKSSSTTEDAMQDAEMSQGAEGTPLLGIADLANTPGVDWESILDSANFSWFDSFSLEI